MKSPKIPDDEESRLAELRSLEVLDTAAEERFDELTRRAAHYFNVPIALISLVDTDRQWFKSAFGLAASQTPREVSFCGHAVAQDSTLVVHDAWSDDRFSDNPLVMDNPQVRFYAGRPIHGPTGQPLGTFCIIDHVPRELSERDLSVLNFFADQAEAQLGSSAPDESDDAPADQSAKGTSS
ncbi:MAG: GAF domain-containing protein [Actinomycetes bacterium]